MGLIKINKTLTIKNQSHEKQHEKTIEKSDSAFGLSGSPVCNLQRRCRHRLHNGNGRRGRHSRRQAHRGRTADRGIGKNGIAGFVAQRNRPANRENPTDGHAHRPTIALGRSQTRRKHDRRLLFRRHAPHYRPDRKRIHRLHGRRRKRPFPKSSPLDRQQRLV